MKGWFLAHAKTVEQREQEWSDDPDTFRAQAGEWIAANFPPQLKGCNPLVFQNDADAAAADADFELWRERVANVGLGMPHWPRKYGGAGLTAEQADIIRHELASAGAFNPMRSNGTMMLGPTLVEYGTEEQKLQHLPYIASHERRWCQGFSEPGAGSDLASLKTRAEDMGDHFLVNGQKIWTSGGDQADWCFCLVRTDNSRKQAGISFLLIDMKSPGVEARPIVLISGSTHFSEVFLSDVKVPKANLVGEINQGWSIAKRLLTFERGGLTEGRGEAPSLAPLARAYAGTDSEGRIADSDLRGRLIRNALRSEAYNLTLKRYAADAAAQQVGPIPISAIKNLGSSVAQERSELLIELMGWRGLGWEGEGYDTAELEATRAWLHSKAFSIYGGSYEVQHNITSKRVLNLPDQG